MRSDSAPLPHSYRPSSDPAQRSLDRIVFNEVVLISFASERESQMVRALAADPASSADKTGRQSSSSHNPH